MMFFIYEKISDEEIRVHAEKLVPEVEQWFKNHPKRKTCRVEVWYGKILILRRKDYKLKIEEAKEAALWHGLPTKT